MTVALTRVLVLRAWREQDHVRVRILVTGADGPGRVREVVCDSADDAAEIVRTLLVQLERRSVDGGADGGGAQ